MQERQMSGLELKHSSGEISCTGSRQLQHLFTGCIRNAAELPTNDFRCTWCRQTAHPFDCRPQTEIQVRPDKLEVVAFFCYLDDMLFS